MTPIGLSTCFDYVNQVAFLHHCALSAPAHRQIPAIRTGDSSLRVIFSYVLPIFIVIALHITLRLYAQATTPGGADDQAYTAPALPAAARATPPT